MWQSPTSVTEMYECLTLHSGREWNQLYRLHVLQHFELFHNPFAFIMLSFMLFKCNASHSCFQIGSCHLLNTHVQESLTIVQCSPKINYVQKGSILSCINNWEHSYIINSISAASEVRGKVPCKCWFQKRTQNFPIRSHCR